MGMGDELMATGQAKLIYAQTGRKVMIVDARGMPRKHEIFNNNPKILQPRQPNFNCEILRNHSGTGRPYFSLQNDRQFIFKPFKPEPGELFFTHEELKFASQFNPCVILEPNIKNAVSVDNKDWGFDKWLELGRLLTESGVAYSQLSQTANPVKRLPHAELIVTPTFRLAAAVIARAHALAVTEGGLHHAAAAVNVPAVVIYGGFISPEQTGYDLHVNIFTGGQPCGSKFSCNHCKQAMSLISPQTVFENLQKILAKKTSETAYTKQQTL
jgi:ADP-heptose:LPS heptosyltransferase